MHREVRARPEDLKEVIAVAAEQAARAVAVAADADACARAALSRTRHTLYAQT